jgi:hypothetical protein
LNTRSKYARMFDCDVAWRWKNTTAPFNWLVFGYYCLQRYKKGVTQQLKPPILANTIYTQYETCRARWSWITITFIYKKVQ